MDDSTRAEFADFVAVQVRPLLGFAHALTADPHDAWDLTQETLARMGERWGRTTYDLPAAYARTVMVRLNIDRIRRLRRELPRSIAGPEVAVPVEDLDGMEPWLVDALSTLSPRQRTALALRYVEDLDVSRNRRADGLLGGNRQEPAVPGHRAAARARTRPRTADHTRRMTR